MKHLRLAKVSTLEAANAFLEKEYWPEWNAHFARPVADFPNQHRALTPQLDLAAILCHVEERVIGNDYTFSFAGRRYQIERAAGASGHAPPALARGTPPGRRVEGALSRPLRGDRRVRHARRSLCEPKVQQTGSQRSQCGRPEQLDAGLLRSPQPAAVEVDRRLRGKNQFGTPGKPGDFAFLCPKPQLGEFHQSNGSRLNESPPGAPVRLTGSASQEGSRRLLRSQPRRLGFGQPRQARPRHGCANIP